VGTPADDSGDYGLGVVDGHGSAPGSTPKGPSVELLADHIELAPIIARWHFDEWSPFDPGVTVDDVATRLSSWANRDSVPVAYVAIDGGVPVGSASLVVHDMAQPAPGCADLTPWLSGVFVVPERRGTGLGPAVVGACEALAAQLGYPAIYLYTAARTAERFYRPMGWRTLDVVPFEDRPVTVMVKDLVISGDPTPPRSMRRGHPPGFTPEVPR
jgi:GNAT superfamily N-acetyltransferase